MKNLNFIALDFETANEKRDSVCSMGVVFVKQGIIYDKKYRLIKPPEMRFNWRNIEVHGIQPEEVENELEFYRYWTAINKMLTQNGPVIAHNAPFDISVLRAVLKTYQIDAPEFSYNCSLKLARKAWKGLDTYSLGPLAKRLGFELNHHHALDDAEMCANVIIAACKSHNANSVENLSEILEVKMGSF